MNWEAMGVIIAIFSGLLAIATAYLRLFVKNELSQLREDLMKAIKEQYVSKEIFETKWASAELRLARLEGTRI